MTHLILMFKIFAVCAGIWTADNTLVWKDGVERIEYKITPERETLTVFDGENEMGYINVELIVSGQSATFYTYGGSAIVTIYPQGMDIHKSLLPTR